MTREAAKRADDLIEQAWTEFDTKDGQAERRALVNLIQHVSDVAERAIEALRYDDQTLLNGLHPLILPKPKPDPLAEVWAATLNSPNRIRNLDAFCAELAKRGGRIVFGGEHD